MKFFTADQHFGHENIIKYVNRPFNNLKEMNKVLISKWNDVVTNNDEIFIIGDFCWPRPARDSGYYERILEQLNGTKHLILGNHDELKPFTYLEIGFTSVHTSLEIGKYILFHDPAAACIAKDRTWLCGHIHDLFKACRHVINVGVDVWDFKPISLNTIERYIETEIYHN